MRRPAQFILCRGNTKTGYLCTLIDIDQPELDLILTRVGQDELTNKQVFHAQQTPVIEID